MSERHGDASDSRSWQLLERVLDNITAEQRRARRWGIFFKLLTFVYLLGALALLLPGSALKIDGSGPFTAMVRVEGAIADREFASADNIVKGLRRAFELPQAKAVMLVINSPGGSPVQAGYVYQEIRRLRQEHPDKKLYAVIGDVGASGAYYIAAAADEIYADQASLVGSIGVISGSFGVTELMEKLGVERRLFTSGPNKALLDPFSPLPPEQAAMWQSVIEQTHRQFVERVRAGRGERLQDAPEIFSGMVWAGETALELGLIDGLASPGQVAREIIGAEKVIDVGVSRDPFSELAKKFGVGVGMGLARSMLGSSGMNELAPYTP